MSATTSVISIKDGAMAAYAEDLNILRHGEDDFADKTLSALPYPSGAHLENGAAR